ncbi:hypothetical protein Vadar_006726 [Vaccinium darrowii]|uniref:Uncharacterized protein n=1 Tax=Vaccinium darrowii TaxID=229202 RepID=A0ACB7XP49_9ERIC|nr:hypothetical protein Vadar_006726 [Vaccinium darrowii]
MLQEEVGAGFGFGNLDGFGYFEECGNVGFGEVTFKLWSEVGFLVDVCCGGERVSEEEREEEEREVWCNVALLHWCGVMLLCFTLE